MNLDLDFFNQIGNIRVKNYSVTNPNSEESNEANSNKTKTCGYNDADKIRWTLEYCM